MASVNWVGVAGDHPRIRGEHSMPATGRLAIAGSSPHTRGARRRRCPAQEDRRIIPAYAGSTWSILSQAATMADHPRIRGEHETAARARPRRVGSSPHTRGARRRRRARPSAGRIIPASAGSTGWRTRGAARGSDHPRIRGEHPKIRATLIVLTGSSPHTRGAREDHGGRRQVHRIIPAYAGSTARDSAARPTE